MTSLALRIRVDLRVLHFKFLCVTRSKLDASVDIFSAFWKEGFKTQSMSLGEPRNRRQEDISQFGASRFVLQINVAEIGWACGKHDEEEQYLQVSGVENLSERDYMKI